MTEPSHDVNNGLKSSTLRQAWAVDQDDRQLESSRGIKLGARAVTARIFGNDMGDVVDLHQCQITDSCERAASENHFGVRQWQWCLGRVDDPQQIEVLCSCRERYEFLFADGEKDAGWLFRQRRHRSVDISDVLPIVTGAGLPLRAFKGDKRYACPIACDGRIATHLRREWVGGVDDVGNAFLPQVGDKAVDATKSSYARGHRLLDRRRRTAGVREHACNARLGQHTGDLTCFRRAAQKKDARHE